MEGVRRGGGHLMPVPLPRNRRRSFIRGHKGSALPWLCCVAYCLMAPHVHDWPPIALERTFFPPTCPAPSITRASTQRQPRRGGQQAPPGHNVASCRGLFLPERSTYPPQRRGACRSFAAGIFTGCTQHAAAAHVPSSPTHWKRDKVNGCRRCNPGGHCIPLVPLVP
jgi:hypothetical protein